MADKVIIDVNPEWPFWQRLGANIINGAPVFFWVLVTYFLIYTFNSSPELVGNRDAMLNIVVPSVAYGILSLISGLALISWMMPYFSFRRIMQTGSPIEKATCMLFWGLCMIAIAMIVAAGIR
jgi:hypothetical protein